MESHIITKSEFATLVGVSVTTIDQWRVSRGFNDCYKGQRIDVKKALKFLYDWKNEEANRDQGDASEVKKYWDSQKSKVQYFQMTGELVPKTPYINAEKERLILLKTGVLNLAEQLAPELNLSPEQKKLVIQKCRALLHNLKETFKEKESEWIDVINSKLEIAEDN